MLCLPPLMTTLKLQLNYRTVTTENDLKYSGTKVLPLRICRKNYLETGRRGNKMEQAGPTAPCDC